MKKNKILKYIVSFVLAIVLAGGVFASVNYSLNKAVVSADSLNVQFDEDSEHVYASNTGLITFKVVISQKLNTATEVYYHTENLTAVDGVDYTGTEMGVVRIPANSYYGYISINTQSTPTETCLLDEYYSRSFQVVLDRAIGVDIGERNIATGSLFSRFTLHLENNNGLTYGVEYRKFLKSEKEFAPSLGTEKVKYSGAMISSSLWYEYHETLGTEVYGSFYMDNLDMEAGLTPQHRKGSITFGDYEFCTDELGYKSNEEKGNIAWVYFDTNISDNNKFYYSLVTDYFLYGENPYDGMFSKKMDIDESWTNGTAKKLYKDPNSNEYNGNVEGVFFKVEPKKNMYGVGLACKNNCTCLDMYYHGGNVYMRMLDEKVPEVVSSYIDDTALARTGKLRLILRFSEPVHLSAKNNDSLVSVYFNGEGLKREFRYLAGEYTDTLCYEWDAKTDVSYKTYRYEFDSVSADIAKDEICDFAYNINSYKKVSNNTTGSFSQKTFLDIQKKGENFQIDYLKPSIKLTQKTSGYSKQHTFKVSLPNVPYGTIYYRWDTSKEEDRKLSNFEDFTVYNEETSPNVSIDYSTKDTQKYYLHIIAISPYGVMQYETSNFVLFDNIKPTATVTIDNDKNQLGFKTFDIQYYDSESFMSTVTLNISDEDGNNRKSYLLYNHDTKVKDPLLRQPVIDSGQFVTHYYSATYPMDDYFNELPKDAESIYYPADDKILSLLSEEEPRKTFNIWFSFKDNCGNTFDTYPESYTYDIRAFFETQYVVMGTNGIVEPLTDIKEAEVYDMQNSESNTLTINTDQTDGYYKILIERLIKGKLTIKGGTLKDDVIIGNHNEQTISIVGLTTGQYLFKPYFIPDSAEGDESKQLVSNDISICLTNGKNEDTANYSKITGGKLALINKVVQLNEVKYYFRGEDGKQPVSFYYGSELNEDGKYTGGSAYPSFSSKAVLIDYVEFMEYQDLYMITLDAKTADYLNKPGNMKYVKANNETKVAKANQRWIRYKQSNFNPDSNSQNDWVYYFYDDLSLNGEENVDPNEISKNKLSTNLKSAISSVVNTIVNTKMNRVIETYLVEDDQLYSNKSPKLSDSQIHYEMETVLETKMGNTFEIPLEFEGDIDIYSNKIVYEDNKNYYLASNLFLTVSKSTLLYYRYEGKGDWKKIKATDGESLRDALGNVATGIFEIREIDEYGMREYMVFIDADAPSLKTLVNKEEMDIDDANQTVNCYSFSFVSMRQEADKYAYVAIFSYPGWVLQNVYYANEIAGVVLNENHYVRVGDRSGNVYDFAVLMSTEELIVTITESSLGNGVIVNCPNRNENEIYRYEVYCNNELISTEFPGKPKLYTQSGTYLVNVQDIYGFSASPQYTFNRSAPEVTWYYMNSSENFSVFNEKEQKGAMLIESDKEVINKYFVYTASQTRFKINDNIGTPRYELKGLELNEYVANTANDTITVNKIGGWSVSIWYEEYPNCVVYYECISDTQAPEVTVNYLGNSYIQSELAIMEKTYSKTPTALVYEKSTDTMLYAYDGDKISAVYSIITVDDNKKLKNVLVYINDKLVSDSDGTEELKFVERGSYRIVATDIFNNQSIVSFENITSPLASFSVDGVDNFSGSLEEVLNGNKRITAKTTCDSEVELLIRNNAGSHNYLHYLVKDGEVFKGVYELTSSGGVQDIINVWDSEPLFVLGNLNNRPNTLFELYLDGEYGVYLLMNDNGIATFVVDCIALSQEVEIRVSNGSGREPSYRKILMSKSMTDVPVYAGEQLLKTNQNGTVIFANHSIKLGEIPNDIQRIEVAYSTTLNFENYSEVYNKDKETAGLKCEEKGFYNLRITNVYGNVLDYYINYTDSAQVYLTVTYADGEESVFSSKYNGVIKTNNSVTITAYGQEVVFNDNGVNFDGVKENEVYTYKEFYEKGEHTITVTDQGGTSVQFKVSIDNEVPVDYNDGWITGYESSLGENIYTNKKLSVNVNKDIIYRVSVLNDGKHYVVYDVLTENTVTDESLWENCICRNGDGIYVVYFRNEYGNLVTKTVNYRETPTLTVMRRTAMNGNETKCDINECIERGVYSSNSISFSTCASNYTFTVGDRTLPLSEPFLLEFNSMSGDASFEYLVSYYDEYGFNYSFKAVLQRRTVQINTDDMKIVDIDGYLYTKDKVSITFGSEYEAKVSLNDGKPVDYVSGTKLGKDGTYHFIINDIAGNLKSYNVTRKSYNKYNLMEINTEKPIIKGGVTNSSISFNSLDKMSKIAQLFRNGVEVKEYTSTVFNQMGYWELLIVDSVGNTAYFDFYIVNHATSNFSYTAPRGYSIYEVWKTDEYGNPQLDSQKGESILLVEDGNYSVSMRADSSDISINFTVTIDNTVPKATLVGVEEGKDAVENVTIDNLSIGDIVYIYKDGVLKDQIEITSIGDKVAISDGGNYKVVIVNEANVSTTYTFRKKQIANVAGSVLILVACLILATGLFIGLLYRNTSRTDK